MTPGTSLGPRCDVEIVKVSHELKLLLRGRVVFSGDGLDVTVCTAARRAFVSRLLNDTVGVARLPFDCTVARNGEPTRLHLMFLIKPAVLW